jgi:hypothetical protein
MISGLSYIVGLDIQDDNLLLQFTTQTEYHYARKKHQHCLESVRKLLTNYNFTSIELRHMSWQCKWLIIKRKPNVLISRCIL